MDITKVEVTKYNAPKNNLKGFARVTLDDELVLTGIKILKGSKGLFIGMPSQYSAAQDEYFDIYFPITADFREELQEEILAAYEDAEDEKPKKKGKKSSGKKKSKKDDDEEEDD